MSSMNGRTIQILRLHAGTHLEGMGNLTSPINKNARLKYGGIKMTKVEGGVLITAKGDKKENIEAFIPDTNVVSAQLDNEKDS